MENKFRYYDPFNEEFVYSDKCKSLASFFCNYDLALEGGNNPVLELFTGLKDKNGVEIYFGDILATENDGNDGADTWSKKDFGYTICEEYIKELGVDWSKWCPSDDKDSVYNFRYTSVIGSIHTNPQLLKGDK